MRTPPRFHGLFIALAVLLATPAAVLAQDDIETESVTITVTEAPQLLTLSATYAAGAANVTTDGGTANGELAISVLDERPVHDGWNVFATLAPFTRNGVIVPALASTGMVVNNLVLTSPGTGAISFGTLNASAQGLLAAFSGYPENVPASWTTAVTFPAGIATGTYESVLTFELIGGDPA